MVKDIDLAVSLYGFTERFVKEPGYGFEEMFQDVNRLGVKKVEIVGAQVFNNYPAPLPEEINKVLTLAQKYGIEIYSYGGYIDVGKITGHDMSDDEMIHELILDLMTAKKLGCRILRAPFLPIRLLPRVAKLGELYNIKIGFEIHAPDTPSSPKIKEYRETFEKINSPYLGFIPDFGCFIERPNPISVEYFEKLGAKRDLLNFIVENRWNGYTEKEMTEKIMSMGGSDVEKVAISAWYGYMAFGPADLEGFKEILPYCIFFHGKFYHIDEDCKETTIPYEKLLQMIVESGFKGTFLSEYEGHTFYLNDAFEQLERHLKMVRNILNAIDK